MSARTRSVLRTLGLALSTAVVATSLVFVSGTTATAVPVARHDGPQVSRDDHGLRYRDDRLTGRPTVQVSGTLQIATGEQGAPDRYGVTTASGRTVPLRLNGVAGLRTGQRVTASVVAAPGTATTTLASSTRQVASATFTDVAAAATPVVRRLFMAVITNMGTVPGNAPVIAAGKETASYWGEQMPASISSFTSSDTVLRYASAYSADLSCGLSSSYFEIRDEARAKFAAQGIGPNDTAVIIVPDTCQGGGTVGLSTGGAIINMAGQYLRSTLGHEEGHELGLHHANRTGATGCAPDCAGEEYGDMTSVMGYSLTLNTLTALNTVYRVALGEIQPGEVLPLDLPSTSTTITRPVTLQPRASSTGLRSVAIPDPDSPTGGVFYVEYRNVQGRDVGSAYDVGSPWTDFTRGLSVLYQSNETVHGLVPSWMLSVGSGGTSSMSAGSTWTSPSGRVKVQFLADHGPAGADIRTTVTDTRPAQTSTAAPRITGAAGVNVQTDPVVPGTWSVAPDYVTYEWQVDGRHVGSGPTADTFSASAADVGKAVTVTEVAHKDGYRLGRRTSAPVTITWMRPQVPEVSGDFSAGGYAYTYDGFWGNGTTFTYKWFADGVFVSTDSFFVIPDSVIGKRLTVEVTGSLNGEVQSRTSAATVPVAGQTLQTATPVVTGAAYVGETLTGSPGTWTAGTTFRYRWLADGTAIPNATGTTYPLTGTDVGKTITFEVSGTKSGYTPAKRTSTGKGPVAYRQLTTAQPTLTGTPEVGTTLTVTPGTWTSGTAFSYRWLADGTTIAGATTATRTLTTGDVGKTITVEVTGTKLNYATATQTSNALGPVTAVSWAPKTPTFPAPRVGTQLTASTDWGSGVTYTYRWYLGSTAITNATKQTYTPTATQVGKYLSVKVTGSKPGHTTTSKVSTKVVIAKGVLTTVVPTISGTPKVGQTLTANPGTWTTGTTFHYQWLSNGVAISTNATSSTYKLPSSKVGKNIKVKVTGSKAGYTTVALISAAVGPVIS